MNRLIKLIEKIFTFLSIASAFIMVLLTAADAMGRYFLNQPITGAYEITENYLMVFLVYFALVYAYREGANIRVTILFSRFPLRIKLPVQYFVQFFSVLFILFLFLSATKINLSRFDEAIELTKKIDLPLWPSYIIISIGLFFLCILIFLDLWKVKKGESGLFKEGES